MIALARSGDPGLVFAPTGILLLFAHVCPILGALGVQMFEYIIMFHIASKYWRVWDTLVGGVDVLVCEKGTGSVRGRGTDIPASPTDERGYYS